MPEVEAQVLAALRVGTEKLYEKVSAMGTTLRKDFRSATLFKRTGDVEATAQGMEAISLTIDELAKAAAEKDAERAALTKRVDDAEARAKAAEDKLAKAVALAAKHMEKGKRIEAGASRCKTCRGKGCDSCQSIGYLVIES